MRLRRIPLPRAMVLVVAEGLSQTTCLTQGLTQGLTCQISYLFPQRIWTMWRLWKRLVTRTQCSVHMWLGMQGWVHISTLAALTLSRSNS